MTNSPPRDWNTPSWLNDPELDRASASLGHSSASAPDFTGSHQRFGPDQQAAPADQGFTPQGQPGPTPPQSFGQESYPQESYPQQPYPQQPHAAPAYAQEQYAQQPYAQQPYAQQPHAAPAYPQQPYPTSPTPSRATR